MPSLGRDEWVKLIGDYEAEYVDNSEGRRRHGEEVHRGDHLAMVSQECHPGLAAFWST